MDLAGDKGSGSIDLSSRECSDSMSESGSQKKALKSCADCNTTKTPLWRSGPTGPKSLCNACGIRYTKKRREMIGPKETKKKDKRRDEKINLALKLQFLGSLGNDVILNKRVISSSSSSWLLKKLGEEEQAAVLLMALSCGFRKWTSCI